MNSKNAKNIIRERYKELRNTLSPEDISAKSIAIANQLVNLPIWEHSVYHIFLSIDKLKEVQTEYILHILQGRDKNIAVSKSNFTTGRMSHYLLTDTTLLSVNTWGIPEPVTGIQLQPNQIDVIFIPLLACDTFGNRIGYGKGFYDRFLDECRPDTLRIGLSFFSPEETIFPTNTTDKKLHYCITDTNIYSFDF